MLGVCSFPSTLMPEERELDHSRQPLPEAVGLVEVVATISFNSPWCWAELSLQVLLSVWTEVKLQRWTLLAAAKEGKVRGVDGRNIFYQRSGL